MRHAMLPLLLLPMMVATKAMAQGVTDVHSHIITPEFLSALEGEGRLLDEGFPLPKYDVAAHLRWMDEAGVQTSVLTLAAPQPQPHPRPHIQYHRLSSSHLL